MGRQAWLAVGLAAGLACAEDPVPGLEAEKRDLLATTLPRQAFWSEVERKGALLKEAKAVAKEQAALDAEAARAEAERAGLEASLAAARSANEAAAARVADAATRANELEDGARRLAQTLEDFAVRSREPDAGEATP